MEEADLEERIITIKTISRRQTPATADSGDDEGPQIRNEGADTCTIRSVLKEGREGRRKKRRHSGRKMESKNRDGEDNGSACWWQPREGRNRKEEKNGEEDTVSY